MIKKDRVAAVCCSVLQCVAVCCSVLQRVSEIKERKSTYSNECMYSSSLLQRGIVRAVNSAVKSACTVSHFSSGTFSLVVPRFRPGGR